MKKALITGIFGQDGFYLSDLLLKQGYKIIGVAPSKPEITDASNSWIGDIEFVRGDVSSFDSVSAIIKAVKPDEIYNLAARSFVMDSWAGPSASALCNAVGPVNIFDSVNKIKPDARIFQASTCEIFGDALDNPQTEDTIFRPETPYGISKLYAHLMALNYRKNFNLFISCGILFNHESPLRPENFVTRKITSSAARIRFGLQERLELGNLNAKRDWGFAGDYVRAMYLSLQNDCPEDFVIASGEARSVREFCSLAFRYAGFEIVWEGRDLDEKGIDVKTGKTLIEVNPAFFRPSEVNFYRGLPLKAEKLLHWKRLVSFEELVFKMTESDLQDLSKK